MSEQIIQAPVSLPQKTFIVVCPACHQKKDFHLDDLPPDTHSPFAYECSCGRPYKVLLNYRKFIRKRVNLAGSFTLLTDLKKIPRPCTVLDISSGGMRLASEPIKNLQKGHEIHSTIILDDKARTKLELRATVKQIIPDKGRTIVCVEFSPLNPYQQEVLGFYFL